MNGPITPFRAPFAPKPEPEAVLKFGDIEIRLTLTYLHHLRNCGGWGDRQTTPTMQNADEIMSDAMRSIERAMWSAIDREKAASE